MVSQNTCVKGTYCNRYGKNKLVPLIFEIIMCGYTKWQVIASVVLLANRMFITWLARFGVPLMWYYKKVLKEFSMLSYTYVDTHFSNLKVVMKGCCSTRKSTVSDGASESLSKDNTSYCGLLISACNISFVLKVMRWDSSRIQTTTSFYPESVSSKLWFPLRGFDVGFEWNFELRFIYWALLFHI